MATKSKKLKSNLICSLSLALLISKLSVANEYLLAIDVGHSKTHPGAISARGKSEFGFNVALAKSIHEAMSSHFIPTLQIGSDGDIKCLQRRTQVANRAGVKFFLSIHHDSVQPQFLEPWQWQGVANYYSNHASGFSLFVSRKNPFLTTSLQCATAIGIALKQKGLHSSAHHAEPFPGEGKEWADKENGIYYYDDLVVLKTAKMPAALLEAGVIVNRDEEQILQTSEMRNVIADAISDGLLNCGVLINKSKP